jgi:hypothetical protein
MNDDLPNTPTDDILGSFFAQLQLVEADNRSLVIITHGFVDLLLNTVLRNECKHGRTKITANNRDYPYSVKLVIMNELDLIDDRLFKILDWFRKLRNRAAHEPFFQVEPVDLEFSNKSMDRFVSAAPKQDDLLRFCMYLVGTVWNRHIEIMQKVFSTEAK